jgi:hypothetical protein
MIKVNDLVRTIVTDVEEVIVYPIKERELSIEQLFERRIRIQTMSGENFDLELYSGEKEKLGSQERTGEEWLIPKVYKGKSMHEMEMDEDK